MSESLGSDFLSDQEPHDLERERLRQERRNLMRNGTAYYEVRELTAELQALETRGWVLGLKLNPYEREKLAMHLIQRGWTKK